MKTIWKFTLQRNVRQTISVPVDAKFIHCGIAQGDYCLWAEVETGNPLVAIDIGIVGTGHEMHPLSDHLGSIIDDPFVWHVYSLPHTKEPDHE